jgi:hypothetical protein
MNSSIQRRLEQLESSTGPSDEIIKVERYELSDKGELILLPDPRGVPDDGRRATHTIRIIYIEPRAGNVTTARAPAEDKPN